jgi:hypothetical protein
MAICGNAGTSSATLQAIRKTYLPYGTIFETSAELSGVPRTLSNILRGQSQINIHVHRSRNWRRHPVFSFPFYFLREAFFTARLSGWTHKLGATLALLADQNLAFEQSKKANRA